MRSHLIRFASNPVVSDHIKREDDTQGALLMAENFAGMVEETRVWCLQAKEAKVCKNQQKVLRVMEGHILESMGGTGFFFPLDFILLAFITVNEPFVALYRHQMICYCKQTDSSGYKMVHSVLNVRKAEISEHRSLPPAEDQLWP